MKRKMKGNSIQTIALKYSKFFDTDNPRKVVTAKNTPKELHELIRAIHGDMLPDDYKHEYIRDAFDAFSQNDEEIVMDCIEPDPYTHSKTNWLKSHIERQGYVDEAVSEFGHSEAGVMGDIALGQWVEMREVYGQVVEFIKKQL